MACLNSSPSTSDLVDVSRDLVRSFPAYFLNTLLSLSEIESGNFSRVSDVKIFFQTSLICKIRSSINSSKPMAYAQVLSLVPSIDLCFFLFEYLLDI